MLAKLCRIMLKFLGWEILGQFPHHQKKCIIACVPHTSNWDFPIGVLVRGAESAKVTFFGKATLFKPPFGWLFRAMNGLPVDRSQRTNFVQQVVDEFNKRDSLQVIITPEGTRRKVEKLKSGFYYIAKGASIPIVPVLFNWKDKKIIFKSPFFTSVNEELDKLQILEIFRQGIGKIPEWGIDEKTVL